MKNMIYTILLASMVTSLVSCSDESPVLTQRDWDGTANYFSPIEEKTFGTYYQPYVGYVGDPMPFYDPVAEDFKIMYLQDFRPNPELTYHPIWAVSTKDLSSYTSMGELIPCGTKTDVDAALGTGSTIYNEEDKLYYTFYTGHTAAQEVVMLATSPDFKTWTKNRTLYLQGGDYGYDVKNFRDPFVFKGDDGMYHMIISTLKNGKGSLVEFTSSDLLDWQHKGVFMTMMWNRFYECPDIFKMGDWWYLVYSEQYKTIRKVQYFMASTFDELKDCTLDEGNPKWPDDKQGYLDSRAFYAGKTASDGTDRYIWGWCPTREGNNNSAVSDKEEPQWAGALVAHKLIQNPDGTLVLGAVEGIAGKYNQTSEVKVMEQSEEGVQVGNGEYKLSAGTYALFNRLNVHNKISFTVKTTTTEDVFGFSFCRGTDSEKYYSMIVNYEDNGTRKLNFEEDGNTRKFISGADSYNFSNPADMTYDITILTDNSVCVVYINDELAYTNRVYGLQKNCWSINCYDGDITVSNLSVMYY